MGCMLSRAVKYILTGVLFVLSARDQASPMGTGEGNPDGAKILV